ncbi:MAG TPA: glycosyltransferase family 8 protein [Clostridiales bacterium]|nr:glycosyltransferase family 8 protein [Clostridiales bacterium]
MNLLITINANYRYPFKVMLHSFFVSNPHVKDLTIYLLHSHIPSQQLEELERCCAVYHAKLIPIAVDPSLFENAPTNKRYPKEMYYRLLSPLILPEHVDRVLYLDPDTLIINPIQSLWEMDLQGNAFAAASHTGLTEMANGINFARLSIDHEYFNTGIMLIDLAQARKIVKADDIFQCVSKYEKILILPDQDVFNVLYGDQTLPVDDVIWNYDVRNYSKYVIRSKGKYDWNWVMHNTAILHFCGKNKPWNNESKNPFVILYRHYMSLSEKKLCILQEEQAG